MWGGSGDGHYGVGGEVVSSVREDKRREFEGWEESSGGADRREKA